MASFNITNFSQYVLEFSSSFVCCCNLIFDWDTFHARTAWHEKKWPNVAWWSDIIRLAGNEVRRAAYFQTADEPVMNWEAFTTANITLAKFIRKFQDSKPDADCYRNLIVSSHVPPFHKVYGRKTFETFKDRLWLKMSYGSGQSIIDCNSLGYLLNGLPCRRVGRFALIWSASSRTVSCSTR